MPALLLRIPNQYNVKGFGIVSEADVRFRKGTDRLKPDESDKWLADPLPGHAFRAALKTDPQVPPRKQRVDWLRHFALHRLKKRVRHPLIRSVHNTLPVQWLLNAISIQQAANAAGDLFGPINHLEVNGELL